MGRRERETLPPPHSYHGFATRIFCHRASTKPPATQAKQLPELYVCVRRLRCRKKERNSVDSSRKRRHSLVKRKNSRTCTTWHRHRCFARPTARRATNYGMDRSEDSKTDNPKRTLLLKTYISFGVISYKCAFDHIYMELANYKYKYYYLFIIIKRWRESKEIGLGSSSATSVRFAQEMEECAQCSITDLFWEWVKEISVLSLKKQQRPSCWIPALR